MLSFLNGSQKIWTVLTIVFLTCSFATHRQLLYHWLTLFGLSLTLLVIGKFIISFMKFLMNLTNEDLMFNYGNDQFLYDPEWKSWKSKNERGNNY